MNNNTKKIMMAIDQNPELLKSLLNADPDDITRSNTRANPLINVLGDNVSSQDLNVVSQELAENPVVQLYIASSGSLDATDLINYVGGVSGTRAGNNSAVRALFDGKLDIKEIMLIIVLLKLFKRKNANTYNNSAIGLLGSLLGFNNNNHNTSSSLLSSLFGMNNSYSTGIFSNNYSNGLFGNQNSGGLFGNSGGLFGYNNYNSNSGLGNFLGLTGNSYSNNSGLQNLLNFVNGNYNNNYQYQQLYNILNGASNNAVNSSGMVSASGLFGVLSQLIGG